jgi:hypothetical protein
MVKIIKLQCFETWILLRSSAKKWEKRTEYPSVGPLAYLDPDLQPNSCS